MNKLLLILIALSPFVASAQTVTLREGVATQLIFPTKIEHHRGGFNPADFVTPQVYDNILYIQPLGTFDTSNLSVITTDGCHYSIKLIYNTSIYEDYYVFTKDLSIFNRNEHTLRNETSKSTLGAPINEDRLDPTLANIFKSSGYISTRNAVKYKSLMMSIIGVYSSNDKIYLRLSIDNSSHIPYAIEHISFMLQAKPTSKLTSTMSEVLVPVVECYQNKQIAVKSTSEVIFGFNKFTVGMENMLLVDLVEDGGARNLSLTITDEILLNAKQLQ